MNIFVRAWKGQSSLAAAFWLVYFVGSIILYYIITFTLTRLRPDLMRASPFGHMVFAILLPYTLYSAICVWRCGRNSEAFWRILSRIVIILAIIGAIASIISVI